MKGKQQDFRTEKYIRYGIRKYSFGAASVAIAAGLMFLGNGAVSAAETAVNGNVSDEVVVSPNTEDNNAKDKDVTPVVADKDVKEETKPEVATPKLDKSQLESYVNEVAGKLAAGKYANKTDESLALLNADLEAAKAALSSATSQDELKAAYNKLVTTVNSKLQNKPVEKKAAPAVDTTNGKETVGKKAENTEKKSESNAIENTGSKDERNGKELVQGSHLRSANEGYTLASTELRKENGEFATATGKSYKVLDNNADYKIYVHGYQSENIDVPAANNGKAATSGRTDIPLSKTEAQKISDEATLWTGKPRVTGKANGRNVYGAGGAYEYLTTEIYGYTYQQGNHYVYLKDVKERFSLSPEATAAGYTITKIDLSNLPPGLAYNSTTDTVEGYIASELQNGVYDMRYEVTVSHNGTTQKVTFKDLTAGWIGWQDSSAPLIQGTSKLVTIGDQVNHNIKYIDNDGMSRDERAGYVYSDSRRSENGQKVVAGSATASTKTIGATFTAVDGTTVKTMAGPRTITAHTALNGDYTGSQTSINDVVPGLNYNPQNGDITGTATEAGIFTATVYAKDYNNTTNATNQDWNMYGQEAHENITIAVAPKITVKNVEAYATNVPVTISKGANKAEITMPDGTVTKLAVKNGKWVVAAGTTNTAVQEGAELADASTTGDSTLDLTVTPESTKYVGVDSIVAKATTDRVQANLQREVYTVKGVNNKEYTATFNSATGKYNLPTEDAYQLVNNGDGTSTLTERRVYTDAKANGDTDYIVYEFTRKWSATSDATSLVDKIAEIREKGHVTEVKDVTRTITSVPKVQVQNTQGNIVTVNYDSVTKRWTASDGSIVTATESNAGWKLETDSGFKGYVSYREASSTDVASIQNAKPTGTSTSYSEAKGTTVDLIKSTKANVAFADTIDDKTSVTDSDTIKTKVTATAPDGTVTTFDGAQTEETAYIQAQRTAAEKTKAAATAVKEQQDTQNELANLQELLDRQSRIEADAQKALDNLKLRSISPTAQELAERKLKHVKEFKASVEKQLATAQANLLTKNTEVESTRAAALEAEKAVETARAALKTAAEANLAKANAYVLSQKGRYKVTARAVDSNGVVTTPTVDETNAGEVTEDAVAETTYYIVVTESEKSSGAQGQKQTDSMVDNFNDGKEGTTVSDYKLVDPTTGNKVSSVTTDQGTYTVDSTTGEVSFTPVEGFVGTATPMKVSANVTFNDESGTPVTVATENTYTPTVYGIQPSADETTGKQGQTQTSKSGKDRFSELNNATNTPDGTNVDWATAAYSLEGANEKGEVEVEREGTYSIDSTTGVVTFKPLPTFKGEGKGVNVQVSVMATDSEGNQVPVTSKGKYTPTVTGVTPTAKEATSTGIQGETQTGTPKFTQGDETAPITINEEQPAKFVVNGQPVDDKEIPATKDGKEVGKYVINPLTGVITFKPNKDFVGTPNPATVEVKDKNRTPVTATYTPTVVPVVPTATESATAGKQGQAQTSQIVFDTPDTDVTTLNFAKGETSDVLGADGQPKSVALDKSTLTLLDANGNAVTTVTVDGEGTYTLDKTTNVITFQPTEEFTGKATPVNVRIADTNGTTVTTTYTPTVVAEDGTVIVEYKDEKGNVISPSTTPVNNEKVTTPFTTEPKEIPGYTLVKVATTNGTVDEATKKVSGKVTNDTTTVTYTYRKNVQTATISYYDVTTGAEVAIDSAKVPAAAVETVEGVSNGAIDFTNREKAIAALEKAGYTLVEDSFVSATTADKLFNNDTAVNQNFKVTVKQRVEPVTPNDEKPVPGQPVDPEDPNSPVWPSTAENLELTKTVTRTIKYRYNDENGEEVTADEVQIVTFTRSASINLVTGNVEYTDWSAAQTLEEVLSPEVANYTYDKESVPSLEVTNESTDSTVYVIYKPVAPTTTPATSTDIQGKPQTGTPTYKHADGTELKPTTDNPAKFVGTEETTIPATKDGKTVGTYTIEPTGTVTFTPNKDFVGTPDPAKVVVTDPTNGTTVESSYTPTVTPVTPTGVDTGSTGPKNTPQSGTPTFVPGHKDVPMDNTVPATFEDGTTSKTVPNEGTYTVDATGKVTFTPNKDFVGTATGVTIVRKDTNGTVAKAKYIPTVYEVKSDTQVATVTYKDINGTILGEVDILQGDSGSEMNYSTAERINALKKLGYELVSDEFTKADGSKQSFDNDTKAIQKFVVTVQPRLVPVIPSDVTPVPGQPIDPEDPNSPVWPESVKELTASEEVTRTITYVDGDGKEITTSVTSSVKFTRDAEVNLVTGEVTYGEWKAATTDVLSGNKLPLVKGYIAVSGDIEASTKDQTVKAEDKDIVQKVVYKKLGAWIPNIPGQTNPPRIDYPNDPNGDPTKPGVPTEDIVIPYVPGYIPRDKDGNPLKPVDPEDPTKGYVPPTLPTDPSQDTPINYTKITTSYVTVDPNGKEISIPDYPTVEGNQPKKDIPGYEFVKTTTDKDGNVTHVYRKVVKTTTSFVDESGKPVSPNEEGNQPKKAIPGYEFVKTTTDKDGNVTHVYRKVVKTTTSFVDESGKPVSPIEEGEQPKKAIPGYEFVKTTTDKDGNVTHVYRKVVKTTTSFVDESGKPVSPIEEGEQPKKDIPGYEFVKTTTDKDGNVTHVYRKVVKTTTSFVDESGKPVSPSEEGNQPKKAIPGYEFVKTTTDKDGNVTHVYRKVVPAAPKQEQSKPAKELPNTGTEDHSSLAALGLLGVLSGFGLVARKKKED